MPEWWPVVVFGWPAVVFSVALAACGILSRKPVLLLVSAVVAVPFAYYILGSFGALGGSEPLVSGSCMVIPVRTGLLRAPRGHPQ